MDSSGSRKVFFTKRDFNGGCENRPTGTVSPTIIRHHHQTAGDHESAVSSSPVERRTHSGQYHPRRYFDRSPVSSKNPQVLDSSADGFDSRPESMSPRSPPPPLVHSSDGSTGRRGLTDLDSVSPPMSPRLHDRSSRAAKMEALAHPVPYREHHQLPTAASATARLLHHQQQQHSPSSEHRCPPPPNVTVLQPSFGNPMLSYIYSAAAAAAAAAHQLHHPHFGHMMLNGAGAPDAGQSPPSHHPEASPFLFPLPTAQSSLATEANFAAAAAAAGLQLNPALMLGCSQLASLNPWLYPSYLAAFGGVHNPGLMDNGVTTTYGVSQHTRCSSRNATARFTPYTVRHHTKNGGSGGGNSLLLHRRSGSPASPVHHHSHHHQIPDTSCNPSPPLLKLKTESPGHFSNLHESSPKKQQAQHYVTSSVTSGSRGTATCRQPNSGLKNIEQMLNGLSKSHVGLMEQSGSSRS